ncbi:heavy metal translocating P-type ATPase [Microbacterium sp. RG1]|uniref:heavy metal translocating P-type ATPase n=1 Tax=Microbacterium sp. RG1 TaxID=2489212 RepID=UPI0010CA54FF|nr:heavy metal translocating P-type ATPase [Microbacterium sp. RG1]QCQ15550.1 copper-translocating P-type ATPase [Microbacterium sp. RG1]
MQEHDGTTREAVLDIDGMTCASCVARVEKRLGAVDGVAASVNLATETAHVSYPADLPEEKLVQAVAQAGYTARIRPVHTHGDHEGGHVHEVEDAPGAATLRTRLIVSVALAIPVVALGMVPAWQFPGWQWLSLVLTTPVVLWGGWPFHRATFVNLRHGALTMDTLITMGTFAAFGWSLWALLFGSAGRWGIRHEVVLIGPVHDATSLVYFEVAAAVTVFLLIGRYIEQRSRRAAGAALRALGELTVPEVELADGRTVPLEALRPGDVFLTRPGGTLATDGTVVDGRADVDESMLTGEAAPVSVVPGSSVTGGTIVHGGALSVRADAIGADTRLARIAQLVENAQMGKSRVQRLADRISAVFVPIVIGLAVLTLIGWMLAGGSVAEGFVAAVAVLIIACPCALGLATPVAILVGTGRGAQLGILVTGPDALENAQRVDTVVLDKTGTVTTGQMRVRRAFVASGVDEARARRVAGALEAGSEHPVARALAVADAPAVVDFAAVPGRGVVGDVEGVRAFAGNAALAADEGARLPAELSVALEDGTGTHVVVGWADGDGHMHAAAVFELEDAVREDAAEAVAELSERGVRVLLLTGDAEPVARRVAAEVGIGEVRAQATPEDKLAVVTQLRAEGRRVAMVGDGVNDAAALAASDLGIAMGAGTDAARHAGDITLTGSRLTQVVTALSLSRRVMSVIRGNLFWAFAYNVAALPLAASGLLNPMIAGAAMAFSSLFVVLNSLRLRRAG